MYTKLTLVFTTKIVKTGIDKATNLSIGFKPESFDERSLSELRLFDEHYGQYRKDGGKWADRREYVLLDYQVNFYSIFDLIAPFEKNMDIQFYFERVYDNKDYEVAKACVLRFPKKASFYDANNERDDRMIQSNQCKACRFRAFESGEKIYIRPDNGVGEMLCNKVTGVTTPHFDPVVSQPLKENLVNAGVDPSCFRPAYSKKGKILGYSLYG